MLKFIHDHVIYIMRVLGRYMSMTHCLYPGMPYFKVEKRVF